MDLVHRHLAGLVADAHHRGVGAEDDARLSGQLNALVVGVVVRVECVLVLRPVAVPNFLFQNNIE